MTPGFASTASGWRKGCLGLRAKGVRRQGLPETTITYSLLVMEYRLISRYTHKTVDNWGFRYNQKVSSFNGPAP